MRLYFIFILIFLYSFSRAQSYDVIVDANIYKSYFNNQYHIPVVVVYKLYHAGGSCSRASMQFKNDVANCQTAGLSDYRRSGYDMGHLLLLKILLLIVSRKKKRSVFITVFRRPKILIVTYG